jgi:L-amino acid N-acyltransferase YncA
LQGQDAESIAMEIVINEMQRHHWPEVRAIYAQGLATGLAAFMSVPPVWRSWNAEHLAIGRMVACDADGSILGWSALAPVPDN